MTDGAKEEPPSLDEFSTRLDTAIKAGKPAENPKPAAGVGVGRAMRVGSELLASLFVGALLGWGLDTLFDSKPWMLLVGILFGFAAGVLNVNRAFKSSDMSSGDDSSHNGTTRSDRA